MNYPDECAVTSKANKYVLEIMAAMAEEGNPVRSYADFVIYN